MKDFDKALLVCLFVFSVLFILSGNNAYAPHFESHLNMALDNSVDPGYAPLLRIISGPFAVSESYYFFFVLFILALVLPLLVTKISGNWLGAVFYFSISFWFWFGLDGHLAQALAFVFVLLLFSVKNNWLRLGIVLIGSLAHSTAGILMLASFLFVLLNENKDWFHKFKGFLVCSPFFGKFVDSQVATSIKSTGSNLIIDNGYVLHDITFSSLFLTFIKITPIPFLIVSIKHFFEASDFDFLCLMFFSFFCGLFFGGPRVFYLAGLLMIIGFAKAWHKLKHKRFWTLLVILWGLFLFEQWVVPRTGILC